MTDLSSKTVCFVDNGLFTSFARKIAPSFRKCFYYTPWQSSFPKSNSTKLGDGFSEFERIYYPLIHVYEIDLWVFADLFFADLQVFLVEHGARVWGARLGEELELDREAFLNWCDDNDVLTPQREIINGISKLRSYLINKENLIIKLADGYQRGDMETWKWKND